MSSCNKPECSKACDAKVISSYLYDKDSKTNQLIIRYFARFASIKVLYPIVQLRSDVGIGEAARVCHKVITFAKKI